MSRTMTSYVVVWNEGTRCLIGMTDGKVVRTSPLVQFDETRNVATTRSGSLYQLASPTDDTPPVSFSGTVELPLAAFSFCLLRGTLQLVGQSPTGRLYHAFPETLDPPAALCRATDGRLFRLCGQRSHSVALETIGRLAPSTLVREVILLDTPPASLPQDVLWLASEENRTGLTMALPAP